MKASSSLFLLLAALLAALPLTAEETPTSVSIPVPPGMKPKVTTTPDNKMIIEWVPAEEAAAPQSSDNAAPGGAKPAANGNAGGAKPAGIGEKKAADTPLSGGSPDLVAKLADFDFDRQIGEVPAFTALGVTPTTVTHPQSPRDFAGALLNGVDHHGVLQTGVAIETAPFRLFDLVGTDYNDYRGSFWNRLAYNSSLSIATTKASEKDKAAQLAIGYSAVLYQASESDPLRSQYLDNAFRDAVNGERGKIGPVGRLPGGMLPPVPTSSASLDRVNLKMLEAIKTFRESSWSGTTWAASVAPTWNSPDGSFSGLQSSGYSAWTTFSYGSQKPAFGSNGRLQLITQVQYREGEVVTDPNDAKKSEKQDSLTAGARLRFGRVDFNGFLEGAYLRTWRGLTGDQDGWRAAGGFEKRIGKGTWFVVSAGQDFGKGSTNGQKDSESFAVGSFRFGLEDNPRIEMKTPAKTAP